MRAVQAATATVQAYSKAINAGDVDTIMELFAKDAVLLPEGRPTAVGSKAVGDTYKRTSGFQRIWPRHVFHVDEAVQTWDDWVFIRTQTVGMFFSNPTQQTAPGESMWVRCLCAEGNHAFHFARYAYNTVPGK